MSKITVRELREKIRVAGGKIKTGNIEIGISENGSNDRDVLQTESRRLICWISGTTEDSREIKKEIIHTVDAYEGSEEEARFFAYCEKEDPFETPEVQPGVPEDSRKVLERKLEEATKALKAEVDAKTKEMLARARSEGKVEAYEKILMGRNVSVEK